MNQTAKLFTNDRGQPPETSDVILSRPATWNGFFAALQGIEAPADFLDMAQHDQGTHDRDPFAEWHE